MISSSRRLSSLKRCSPKNLKKHIPQDLHSVAALSPTSDVMKGVLDWLKSERLHKYWPVFSRMSYSTIIGLSEDNFDDVLDEMGAAPITNGARCRILRCTERLRARVVDLEEIDQFTPLDDVADIFHSIATTPLSSTELEPNGRSLLRTFRSEFDFLYEVHGCFLLTHAKFRIALQCFISRPEVPDHDKKYVEDRLKTCDEEFAKLRRALFHSSLPPTDRRSVSQYRKKFISSLSEPSKPNKTPVDNFVCQRPIQFTAFQKTDISFSPFIQYQPAQLPSSALPSSVSFLSVTSSDERSFCAVDCSWPKDPELYLSLERLKLSYQTQIPTVDVNISWGGGKNQVMIDLAVSSA